MGPIGNARGSTSDARSSDELLFYVNGRRMLLPRPDPSSTLLQFLRSDLGLTGTKLGCAEGGCGACTIMVSRCAPQGDTTRIRHAAVNSCLVPLCSLHGAAVVTVEGVGSTRGRLHRVQSSLAESHGSQCGFCTPGIVMSVYTLLRNHPVPTTEQLEAALDGNLCRCTGYRPILEAFRGLTAEHQSRARVGEAMRGGGVQGSESVDGDLQLPVNGVSFSNGCVEVINGSETLDSEHDKLANHTPRINSVPNGCPMGDQCCKRVMPPSKNQESRDIALANGTKSEENSHGKHVESLLRDAPACEGKQGEQGDQEVIFPSELQLRASELSAQTLTFRSERVTWHRPATLTELLELKHQFPMARIVVGNSEVGIELKFKHAEYPVLLHAAHIPDLLVCRRTDRALEVGASVSLTTLEGALRQAVRDLDATQIQLFAAMLEMLRWFAGEQIRNVASLGGNIINASPISDLNPLLQAAGASLLVTSHERGERLIKMDERFFTGYRRTSLAPDEVLVRVLLPLSQPGEYVGGYKQSQRKQDDISIVTCGARVMFEDGECVVKEAALSFGGMAAWTVMGGRTAEGLRGRSWDEQLLTDACRSLSEELALPRDAPGGMVAYRMCLVTSMFYKFFLATRLALQARLPGLCAPLPLTDARAQSAVAAYSRASSQGVQAYERVDERQMAWDAVGRPTPHLSGQLHATGEAQYTDDLPLCHTELHLALVLSTHAHARILSVDPSHALRMDGVHDFITYTSIPGDNTRGVIGDEEVFRTRDVTCEGQAIGAVLADTQALARRAAAMVKVEYEDLKAILTIDEAIAANSFIPTPERIIRRGDVAAGLAASDVVIEGQFRIGGQNHFYLETQACVAVPKCEKGEIEIFSSTQNPDGIQREVARALKVDQNKVVVRVKRIGGGFGGKEMAASLVAIPVAVAAQRLGRPVRCMLDRDEDMVVVGGRHPFLAKYKVGATREGVVQALQVELFAGAGYSLDLSQAVLEAALLNVDNCYLIPHVLTTGRVCRTNLPSNTAFRGFGAPQGILVCEHWMTELGHALGLTAREVRERNLYRERDQTHYGQVMERCLIRRGWDELMVLSDYEARRRAVDTFNSENRWRKRGLAVMPSKHGISFGPTAMQQAGALVHVYQDGSVLIAHGGMEMGQGLHTKMIQIASRVLQLPMERIYISETSTSLIPNASPSAGSCSSDLNGMAVKEACEELMARLGPYLPRNRLQGKEGTVGHLEEQGKGGTVGHTGEQGKSGTMGHTEEEWRDAVGQAYQNKVNLSATGFHDTKGLGYNWETGRGQRFLYYTTGAACSEVEIDCLTGDHTVLRTDIVMDVGKSLNPAVDIGQIEGAFVQGYGLYVLEDVRYLPNGTLFSRGPGTYKIPSCGDIPVQLNVTLLKEGDNPRAIYSSKGVGEPPLVLSASVFLALRDAVEAARVEGGVARGQMSFDSPATAERIRMACGDELVTQARDAVKT